MILTALFFGGRTVNVKEIAIVVGATLAYFWLFHQFQFISDAFGPPAAT